MQADFNEMQSRKSGCKINESVVGLTKDQILFKYGNPISQLQLNDPNTSEVLYYCTDEKNIDVNVPEYKKFLMPIIIENNIAISQDWGKIDALKNQNKEYNASKIEEHFLNLASLSCKYNKECK
jgi:hypothetical protein